MVIVRIEGSFLQLDPIVWDIAIVVAVVLRPMQKSPFSFSMLPKMKQTRVGPNALPCPCRNRTLIWVDETFRESFSTLDASGRATD